MTTNQAKEIIFYVVKKTEPRWRQYTAEWENINQVFIERGFEQGGFHCFKFCKLLEQKDIYSIEKIGSILDDARKYDREYAGSLNAEFYLNLKDGKYGKTGVLFYESVKDFLEKRIGSPGRVFWNKIWCMLVCCSYLLKHYDGDFGHYLKRKFAEFKKVKEISDAELLSTDTQEWERFKKIKKPWEELYGIGEDMFNYILADIQQARFASNLYKFDSANQHFFKVTGIAKFLSSFDNDGAVRFLRKLELPFTLREINKGIYTYCSKTEAKNYGFCYDSAKCAICRVNGLCEKNFHLTKGKKIVKNEPKLQRWERNMDEKENGLEKIRKELKEKGIKEDITITETKYYHGLKIGKKLVLCKIVTKSREYYQLPWDKRQLKLPPVEFILEFAEWCKTHSMSKEVSKFEIPEDLIIKK